MSKLATMRGVNLGGWFVLEHWMTPSVFSEMDARNEFELSRTKEGRARITRHHKNFITKKDLAWLKDQGVIIVRVPIGHWTLGGDDRYVSAAERLDWLMETSLSLGLKVLLDLHAAPGAQNRAEHSGSGNTVSNKHSTKWLNDKPAQTKTIECLVELAQRYRDYPNLWGIELLNEPTTARLGLRLVQFYRRAYRAVTTVARPGTRIVFSDAYAPLLTTNTFWLMTKREFPAIMDVHCYQVFGAHNKSRSFEQHLQRLVWTKWFLRALRLQQPIIVGEWSAMLPIKTTPEQTTQYITAQKKAFEPAEAQFFWNYKTESEGRWNYRDQAEKELIQ
ncbi:cellulase family glycosylhydrolase [Candidatus Saccharibacteria bacterium]|nr:cellulase family glycosylhydrolase [Candidatus Saccharibacteria bacterium]